MKLLYIILSFIIPILSHAQTTVTFGAAKDNTMYSEFQQNSNGAGQYFFVGRNAASNENSIQRALIAFNLASIPPGSVITSASLTVYIDKSAPQATGIALHKLNANWGEGTSDGIGREASGDAATTNDATWLHRLYPSTTWTSPGGDFTFGSSYNTSVSNSINTATAINASGSSMVSDVQGWVNNTATNFGWLIKSDNESTSASVKRFLSRESSNASFRPSLSVTYTSGVVPITLKSFRAMEQASATVLLWTTATELNNAYFNIEHSTNGSTFKPIGKVQGNGSSSLEHNYTFVHKDAATGKNYYRLAQYDLNGAVKYSPVIFANKNLGKSIKIGPNPAINTIVINSNQFINGGTYKITSINGKLAKKGIMTDQSIVVGDLISGMYYLTIEHENEVIFSGNFLKK